MSIPQFSRFWRRAYRPLKAPSRTYALDFLFLVLTIVFILLIFIFLLGQASLREQASGPLFRIYFTAFSKYTDRF